MNLRHRIERLEETAKSKSGFENLTVIQLERLLALYEKTRNLSDMNILTDAELNELCVILEACDSKAVTANEEIINLEDLSDEELEHYIKVIELTTKPDGKTSTKRRNALENELCLRYINSSRI